MVNFRNWIFEHFPYYFRENDSYKDGDGYGLFQRYLTGLGSELDYELTNKIPGLLDLNNAEVIASKHLVHLAAVLGNPPDTFGDETKYRKLLRYITTINKYKGTVRGYELIFGILGVNVVVEEIALTDYRYDSEFKYDDGNIYDGNCPPCSKYNLIITDPDGNCPEIGEASSDPILMALLKAIIKYVEPINAVLASLSYGGEISDNGWVLTTGIWNDSKYWDNSKYYRDEP